ncbi:hypothetical protein FNV43_RR23456 [Rhamnella rubrinervis]|uniref:MSP domain-containing protein n=1 Tax=Rhamnella rubrinervis TaxID=2594499 RepID=A0A8K0DY50_9ROSA|nr:hypothetical protein FNV43_RR23456 [Rhamnella rubrinervis]
MDKLVKPDVKEVELNFKRGHKCSTTFRLTNLMHTMSVAVSLTTTSPLFSFPQPFSIIPPLSSSSYTLLLSQPFDQPPLVTPHDIINVRTSVLPTGKAHQDDLRRLFSRPGPHVFRDATIPISFVGPQVIEFLISNHAQVPELNSYLHRAISGCSGSQLTALLKPAIDSGNAYLISTLIDAGADVNDRDSDAGSMLSLAVRAGNVEIMKILIASGCEIDNTADKILHDAASVNRVDLIEILCKSFEDIDVNSVNSDGRTPIHIAAALGHVEVLSFCVSVGGNADLFDFNGWTPLHFAAAEGHFEAVKRLLDCSNSKYVVNREGKTAFALAADNGHSHLLSLLRLDDLLQRAARLDDVHDLKSCLAEGAFVNGRDQNGWTPLHRAAFKGGIDCVKVLLNHGAHVDIVDDAGYTPLHCAVEAGHVQVALLLISHGANANAKSRKGVVPFNFDHFKSHPALVHPLNHEKEISLNGKPLVPC